MIRANSRTGQAELGDSMSDFAITVNNRRYTIACPAESEARLELAARQLDHHVRPLAERYGKVGDDRLLLLAALQIVDELMSTRDKLEEINALIAKSEQLTALVNPNEMTADEHEGDTSGGEEDDPEEQIQEDNLSQSQVEDPPVEAAAPLDLADLATVAESDEADLDDEDDVVEDTEAA